VSDHPPEWYAQRVGKITGSRLPKILGLSPFGDAKSVEREMVREILGEPAEFTTSRITEWGTEHEDDAINQYQIDRAVFVHTRHGFFQHPKYEWLQIEPDGLVGDDGLVEAKAPWRAKYVHIAQRPDYEIQERLGLGCTGRSWADFIVWRPNPPLWISRIEHDPTWLTEGVVLASGGFVGPIMPVLDEFRARIDKIVSSEKLSEPYRLPLKADRLDEEFAEAEQEYADALAVEAAAAADVEEKRKRLIELSGGRSAKGRFFQVIHSDKRGSINYRKVIADHPVEVDLEQYRGDGTHVVTIRTIGSSK
jgi:putative phage-type endonuclease